MSNSLSQGHAKRDYLYIIYILFINNNKATVIIFIYKYINNYKAYVIIII